MTIGRRLEFLQATLAGLIGEGEGRVEFEADGVFQDFADAVANGGCAEAAVAIAMEGYGGAEGNGDSGFEARAFGGKVQALGADLLNIAPGVLPGDVEQEGTRQARVPPHVRP